MSQSIFYNIAKKCEYPGESSFWSKMNFFFSQAMVLYGKILYKKIKKSFPGKQLLLITSKSAGDCVFYGSFKKYLLDYIDKTDSETVLICTAENVRLYKAMNIPNIYPIPMYKLVAIAMAYKYYGREEIDMINAYSICVFDYGYGQNNILKPERPDFVCDEDKIPLILTNIGCTPGRTVILAPYEKTISAEKTAKIPVKIFWEELANALLERGFDVCTNCAGGDAEPPVLGTKRIFPDIGECDALVQSAGAAVVLRSGFADFAAMTGGNLTVLYPSRDFWKKFRLWNTEDFDNHFEIIYENGIEDAKYRKNLIEKIIKQVEYAKTD